MRALLATFVGLLSSALAAKECLVSDWSDWGACVSQTCDPEVEVNSYQVEAAKWDTGRLVMAEGMRLKEAQRQAEVDCLATGSCPLYGPKTTHGSLSCTNGLAGDKPCRNVDQLSFLSISDLGYGDPLPGDSRPRLNDIWGWRDPLDGEEYVIVGLSGGSSFVRVTDPRNPVVVGFLYSRNNVSSIWRDMKVVNNHVYIVSEAANHGLQVVDLTQFRGQNELRYINPDAVYSIFGNAHNIVANPDTATLFVVGDTDVPNYSHSCEGGLLMIDVSEPQNPRYKGCFIEDGYVHDAQCLNYTGPDARYYNQEICFCYNEDTFTIVVVGPEKADLVSKRGYTGSAYTHQGWVTEDQTIALLDDELDERRQEDKRTKTYIWDIRDLQNPILRRIFQSAELAIDHNQYVKGNYTYQSNYEAGLRILQIDQDNYDLTEVAYFDVLPKPYYNTSFQGTWSNYPYLESGAVAVTSIEYGLYMVQPDWSGIQADLDSAAYAEQTRTRDIIDADNDSVCPPVKQNRRCTPYPCE